MSDSPIRLGVKGQPCCHCLVACTLLIMDNLSDFAPIAFDHTKTLGGSEECVFKSKPVAIEVERQESRLAAA